MYSYLSKNPFRRLSDEQEAELRRFATMKGAKKQFWEWQAGLMQGHSEVKFGKRKDKAPPHRLHDHLSQTSPGARSRERDGATERVSSGRSSPLPPVRDPRSPGRNFDAGMAGECVQFAVATFLRPNSIQPRNGSLKVLWGEFIERNALQGERTGC